MPAQGNAGGERMQQGYAPEGGKRITAHHCRVAKGVNGIIILLPILGECWFWTIPKALPWADLFLAFQAVFPRMYYLGCNVLFPSVRYEGWEYHVLLSFCQI